MRDSLRRPSRRAVALAISVVAHGVVVLALIRTVAWRLASAPPVTEPIELSLVESSRSDTRRPQSHAARATAVARRPVRTMRALAVPLMAIDADHATASPDVRSTGAGPGGGDADLRGALRAALGCDRTLALQLSDDERRRCDRQGAETLRTAPRVDGLPPEKRRYYDAVVEAYASRRSPALIDPTAHGPIIGCRVLFGIPKGWKPTRSGPPNGVHLGPCFVAPPKGFLTEEADLPSPVDLKREAP